MAWTLFTVYIIMHKMYTSVHTGVLTNLLSLLAIGVQFSVRTDVLENIHVLALPVMYTDSFGVYTLYSDINILILRKCTHIYTEIYYYANLYAHIY